MRSYIRIHTNQPAYMAVMTFNSDLCLPSSGAEVPASVATGRVNRFKNASVSHIQTLWCRKPCVCADAVTYINKMADCALGEQALTASAMSCKSSETISCLCDAQPQRVLLP